MVACSAASSNGKGDDELTFMSAFPNEVRICKIWFSFAGRAAADIVVANSEPSLMESSTPAFSRSATRKASTVPECNAFRSEPRWDSRFMTVKA